MAETNTDVNVDVKKETVDVLDSNGATLSRGGALADIFQKAESGTPIDQAVTEVMTPPAVEVKEEKTKATEAKPDTEEVKPTELEARLGVTPERKHAKEDRAEEKGGDKAEPAAEQTKEDEVPEEELQVLAHDKPKTAKRIQTLLKRIEITQSREAQTKLELDQKAARLKDLEDQLAVVKTADPKVDEAIKKQLDELSMYRRRYDLDKDPEVKSKFDDRIIQAEKPVKDVLARNGANEALIKIIEDEGGWLKFTQSRRPIATAEGTKPANEVADLILQALPFADRRVIEAAATEQITTKREKERFFEDQMKTANEFFLKQERDASQRSEDQRKQMDVIKKQFEDFQSSAKTKHKWLQEQAIPDTATPDQKASIEDDNKHTRQLNGLMKKFLETQDIPGMLDVVQDAVSFYNERRLHGKTSAALASKEKEVARLQGEIDKYKNAGKTVARSGSIAGGGNSSVQSKKEPPKSLDAAFDIIASGQSLTGEE